MKILVAGDPGSIHTNRFVSLLQEIGYEVRVFQSEYYYSQEEHLKDTVLYVDNFMSSPANGNIIKVLSPLEMAYFPGFSFLKRCYEYALFKFTGKELLPRLRHLDMIRLLRGWKPDVVFSLKMQNDGYTVSAARAAMGAAFRSKWVHFSWGTDIEYFGKHPDCAAEHLPKIRQVLSQCDFHMADTERDVRQAREFGFNGIDLGSMLAQGGFDLDEMKRLRETGDVKRNVILVKGREGGLVGRAFQVLAALTQIRDVVGEYAIKIIMPTDNVRGVSEFLSRFYGLDIEAMGRLPYSELLSLYNRSLLAISASNVDGTPSFLVEAMVMGALPIHSDMESIREWIDDGVNGLLFPVDDAAACADCIKRALNDKALLDSARECNWNIALERMDRSVLREKLRSIIEREIIGNS